MEGAATKAHVHLLVLLLVALWYVLNVLLLLLVVVVVIVVLITRGALIACVGTIQIRILFLDTIEPRPLDRKGRSW